MKTFERIEESELPALLEEWKKILRLQDWDIIAKIVPLSEMAKEENQGQNDYLFQSHQACIRILRPDDYGKADFPQDMERVLVHELCHILFSFADPYIESNPVLSDYHEAAVDNFARVLVPLVRESRRLNTELKASKSTMLH